MKIVNIADVLHHAPTLARWHHDTWHHFSPDKSLKQRIQNLAKSRPRQIPATYVVVEGDRALGSASLVKSDLSTRPELTPWLASVYVDEQHRKCGIGTAAVQRVMEEARALGVEKLYLITPDQQSFYARMGWKKLEDVHYRDEEVTIMTFAFGE